MKEAQDALLKDTVKIRRADIFYTNVAPASELIS